MENNHNKNKCKDLECDACSPYCSVCSGCGEVGCDGIESFLKAHVIGKTNCKHEERYIADILSTYAYVEENDTNLHEIREKINKVTFTAYTAPVEQAALLQELYDEKIKPVILASLD